MSKQELIDKGISEARGIWPITRKDVNIAGLYKSDTGVFDKSASGKHGYSGWVVSKEEFQQRARELGWVGGFKWGVEYPTNGEKPDLPDDVKVKVCIDKNDWSYAGSACSFNWDNTKHFRITDERYKPIEQTFKKAKEAAEVAKAVMLLNSKGMKVVRQNPEAPPVSAEPITDLDDCSIEMIDWYDYEQQKAITLPPVDLICEAFDYQRNMWLKVKTLKAETKSKELACVTLESAGHWGCLFWGSKFRPLDQEARTKELEKKRVVDAVIKATDWSISRNDLDSLYDKGFLKLPEQATLYRPLTVGDKHGQHPEAHTAQQENQH